MIISRFLKNLYHQSIKFPDRHLGSHVVNEAKHLPLSPNLVKLTNRNALGAAMDEEI
jgi:hypothetical protein